MQLRQNHCKVSTSSRDELSDTMRHNCHRPPSVVPFLPPMNPTAQQVQTFSSTHGDAQHFLRFAVLFAICFNFLLSFHSFFRCSSSALFSNFSSRHLFASSEDRFRSRCLLFWVNDFAFFLTGTLKSSASQRRWICLLAYLSYFAFAQRIFSHYLTFQGKPCLVQGITQATIFFKSLLIKRTLI